VPPGATHVRADREQPGAYDLVAEQRWDAVIDVSRHPGQVRAAVAALEPVAGRCLFVSSGNAYADAETPAQDESAELNDPLDGDVMESMATYGPAKVACEQAILAGFGPDRTLIARAGLIGGPGDTSDRSGYWPLRFARPSNPEGRVLVPTASGLTVQVIDVRDLSAWLVTAAEQGTSGAFNTVGASMDFDAHLEVARSLAPREVNTEAVPAPDDWLLERGVTHWSGPRSLPLWLPLPDYAGFVSRDGSAARAMGLVNRPLVDTLADTLAWERSRPADRQRAAGLSDADERELLDELG
jgi:nucleoside-diphosphate-sugar epimerase